MSFVPTQGNEILVDTPASAQQGKSTHTPGNGLTTWLVSRAAKWRDHRSSGYQKRWAEYWRMWRGQWSAEDRNRLSERSRLIAPALANAIEMNVAEIEEGLFSKEVWFDISDDLADEQKLDATIARDNLREDLDLSNTRDCFSESVLNAAIFGTGIVKINVEVVEDDVPQRNPTTMRLERGGRERVLVTGESIRPDEFIPDPAGRTIGEMLGCFHEVRKPLNAVLEKIASGVYDSRALPFLEPGNPTTANDIDPQDPQSTIFATASDEVTVLEYHGKVPASLLAVTQAQESPLDEVLAADMSQRPDQGDGPMVEAIVTIANNGVILRAMANPFVMKDRSIIAYQFEKVPGRFWGRGVSEKGYNPQKALDSEVRARIDALGYISAPMLGIDYGRVPRGFKMEVKPGKVFLTQGPPSEVLSPIKIGEINAATFNQAGEMERMVQMGTGAFDTATALTSQGANSSGPSASNMSATMGAFVKRSKRSIRNVNDNCVATFIKKAMWRYMQFDPRRYPEDFKFVVKASLGIVAREVEAMQLTQLMAMLPEGFPGLKMVTAKGIIDMSSVHNKAEIMQALEQAMQPPPPEEQQRQQELSMLEFEAAKAEATQSLLENQKLMADIRLVLAEAAVANRKANVEEVKIEQEQQRIEIQEEELDQFEQQNEIAQKRLKLQERQLELKTKEASSA